MPVSTPTPSDNSHPTCSSTNESYHTSTIIASGVDLAFLTPPVGKRATAPEVDAELEVGNKAGAELEVGNRGCAELDDAGGNNPPPALDEDTGGNNPPPELDDDAGGNSPPPDVALDEAEVEDEPLAEEELLPPESALSALPTSSVVFWTFVLNAAS